MAIHQPLYRVIYEGGGWTVVDHEGKRLSGLLDTTGDAVARAKELAVHAGSAQIVVCDRDGKVLSDFMYQREERPSLRGDDSSDDSLFGSHPATRRSSPSRT